MKKTIFTFAVALIGLTAFTGCEKCTECAYTYAGLTVSSGEVCGKSSEIDDFEEEFEASAQLIGATAECTRK